PTYSRDEAGQRRAFARNFFLRAKHRHRSPQKFARADIRNKADEVSCLWIKCAEPRRGIRLRIRRFGKIADRFQTDHTDDLLAPLLASRGVNVPTHLRRKKVRWFFVDERDEP